MLPDPVWNPGPLTYESGALPIALHSRLNSVKINFINIKKSIAYLHYASNMLTKFEKIPSGTA